jgi:hypothetical protein
MSMSRAYLQGLPAKLKREQIKQLLNDVSGSVKNQAICGKTSYLYNLKTPQFEQYTISVVNNPHLPVILDSDFIPVLQEMFPDCTISYQEVWVDKTPRNKVLTKGILIDWSSV